MNCLTMPVTGTAFGFRERRKDMNCLIMIITPTHS